MATNNDGRQNNNSGNGRDRSRGNGGNYNKGGNHNRNTRYTGSKGPRPAGYHASGDAKKPMDETAIQREREVKKRELSREYLDKGSDAQKDMLASLRQEIIRYDVQAVDMIAEGISWSPSSQNETTLDAMNKLYSKALLEQCVRPIIQGRATDEAVFQAAGVMLAGYITNKEFRDTINKGALKVIQPYVDRKSANASPDSKWRRWQEKIAKSQNDGRLPLTPKNAAMMQLGIDRKFYREMREPGADKKALYDSYIKCRKDLYMLAERDGITEAELNKNVRTLVGQMKDFDPAVGRMYNETAFDAFRKGPGHFDKEKGKTLWAGEFVDKKGNSYEGGFSVRIPTGPYQWSQTLDASMQDAFKRCHTAQDVVDLGEVISGGKAPKGKEWMDGWQRRNERDFAVMYDDCATVDDFDSLNRFTETFAQTHMRDWMDKNPKEAEELCRRWASAQASEEGPAYDSADYDNYSDAYAVAVSGKPKQTYANGEEIPPERQVMLPYDENGGDCTDLTVTYGG